MRPIATAAAALLLAWGTTACGGDDQPGGGGGGDGSRPPAVACTEIGCGPALYLDVRAIARQVPQARAVRICLETTCRRFDLRDQLVAMGLKDVRKQVRVAVRMEVLANDGRTLLRRMTRAPVRRSFPNGPECPPPCYSIAVELQPVGLELIGAY